MGECPLEYPLAGKHGLAWGTRGPLMMAIRADFYRRRHFGKIAGYSNVMVCSDPSSAPPSPVP